MPDVTITLRTIDESSDKVNKVKKGYEGMVPAIEKAGKSVASFVSANATLIASLALVGGAIKKSIDAAAEAETVDAKLAAVIRSTGGAAGLAADELDAMATSLSRVSTYDDEAIKSAEALMLTFTKVGEDVFPSAIQATLDMSTALGQDLQSSVIQLGKALNDPIQGITALRRVGVSFTEDQRNLIETMVESGDVLGAQKLILQELSVEFGGQASAAASTYAGQIQQLKNEFGNLQEIIGGELLPDVKNFTSELKNDVIWITENWEALKQWGEVISWVVNPLGKLGMETGAWAHELGNASNAIKITTEELVAYAKANDLVIRNQQQARAVAEKMAERQTAINGQLARGAALTDAYNERLRATGEAAIIAGEGLEVTETSFEGLLSLTQSIGEETRNYNEKVTELTDKQAALREEIAKLEEMGQWKSAEALREEYAQLGAQATALAEEHKAAFAQMQYDLITTKLATDGLTSAEYDLAIATGEALGILDSESASAAKAMNQLTDAVAKGTLKAEQLQAALAMLEGHDYTVDIILDIISTMTQQGGSGAAAGEAAKLLNDKPPKDRPKSGAHASGGKLPLGQGWALVGDMPGGRPTPWSELISPTGEVVNARMTKWLLKNGMLDFKSYSLPDDNLGGGIFTQPPSNTTTTTTTNRGGGRGGGGGGDSGAISAGEISQIVTVEQQLVEDVKAMQVEIRQEVQRAITASVDAIHDKMDELIAVMVTDNPRAIARGVGFEVTKLKG